MRNGTSWLTLFAIFVTVILLLLLFSGCNTAKQDFKNVNKAIIRHEVQTAQQAAARWPRVVVNTFHDSAAYKKSIDSIKALNDFYKELVESVQPIIEHDTIIPECQDYADNELKLQNIIFIKNNQIADLTTTLRGIKPVHDIDTVRNTRQEAILLGKLQASDNNFQRQIDITQKQQSKLDKKDTFLWWLIALLGASLLLHYLRSRFKIPVKI